MGRKITKLETIPVLPKRKRVAAYARVSCDKDTMLHSLAAQVSAYSRLIQDNPEWEYVGVYPDEAETGTKDNRPEFQRLIADCRAGRIDLVITKSISRFARNTVTLLETVRELKAIGVGVWFEEQKIHTQSADGELMLTILASYAQEESRSVSKNQKWRIHKDYAEGRPAGNMRVYGYEYKNGVFTVIPAEAEVVRMIYADYLSGMGKNSIMKKLTRLGIPTKLGGKWSESTIGSILTSEKVIGDICLQKGFITDHLTKRHKKNDGELPKYYVEGSHEGIVDIDTFNAVQIEIARRAAKVKPTAERVFSEFTSLIHCDRCGANFRRKVNNGGTKYVRAIWSCSTYNSQGKDNCAARQIPESILKAKCAEVLGIYEYAPDIFKAKVTAINVPDDSILVFTFKDGTERTVAWENISRRESWSDEMKEVARTRAKRGGTNA